MIAVYVVLRTSAVLFSWLGIAVMCAGCGSLARRGLLRLWPAEPRAERLAVADVWIGLAALVAYLEVWNLLDRKSTRLNSIT